MASQKPEKLRDRYRLIHRRRRTTEDPFFKGGFAEVWEAVDQVNKRLVAIKRLKETKCLKPAEVKKFCQEFEVLSRLDHPNIVKVYSLEQDQDGHFIVMEFIDGASLQELINEGSLTRPKCLQIVKEVLQALACVHSVHEGIESLVHRDIKPGNIMIEKATGRAVLLDFGIARVRGDVRNTITGSTGQFCTPVYASPEQVSSVEVAAGVHEPAPLDHRSDLYSLGVVLYELMSGRPPFTGPADVVAELHRKNPVPRQPLQTPKPPREPVGPNLRYTILKALEKDPRRRFQSAKEMLEQLERPDHEAPSRRKTLRLAAVVVLAVACTFWGSTVLGLAMAKGRQLWTRVFPPPGALAVWAEPQGMLKLDGVATRETPLVLTDLRPGKHALEIVDRIDGAASLPTISVQVVPGRTVAVRVEGQSVETALTTAAGKAE
ncbi:MAG: serine/threonine protein kinase [Candidatus Riflebacteria bacterium]|nr:serine/threonine protein kinase [Candidatus Riflebacteria bacterium]